jgi:hypothetical protein
MDRDIQSRVMLCCLVSCNETPIQEGSPSPPVTDTPAHTATAHTEPALPSQNAHDLSHPASMYPAHVLGLTSSGSRINKNRRHTRHKMRYALSPLNTAMQHPLASECAAQPPLVLQPVFSEEDWNSINSRTSKRARQACKAAILKRQHNDQLQSDLAAAIQLTCSRQGLPRGALTSSATDPTSARVGLVQSSLLSLRCSTGLACMSLHLGKH